MTENRRHTLVADTDGKSYTFPSVYDRFTTIPRKVRAMIADGYSVRYIANVTGLDRRRVHDIEHGERTAQSGYAMNCSMWV